MSFIVNLNRRSLRALECGESALSFYNNHHRALNTARANENICILYSWVKKDISKSSCPDSLDSPLLVRGIVGKFSNKGLWNPAYMSRKVSSFALNNVINDLICKMEEYQQIKCTIWHRCWQLQILFLASVVKETKGLWQEIMQEIWNTNKKGIEAN